MENEFHCENCNEPIDNEHKDKYGKYHYCTKCGYVKGFLYLGF